jgi:netrin-G3 ligand
MTKSLCADKELPAGFPQILQNPGMKVVEKGRNAVLVCEATGEPAPTITWVRDTLPIDLEVSIDRLP